MRQIDEEILEKISKDTKNSINDIQIVTPSIYTDMFSKFASHYNADIKDEPKITDFILSKKISLFSDLQESTSKNAKKLSENTDKAITAIKDKNETTLQEILKETQNLQHEIERLRKSVYKDELTGAYNRKWLNDYCLEDESQNFKEFGTLALIDLNYFKTINDTYGHIVGDKVLVYIANQLKKTKGSVIRYGGDEFVIIFPKLNAKADVIKKLENIREDIIKKHMVIKESSFKVSFSLGAYEFKSNELLSDVIEHADSEMYKDKIEIKKRVTGI